MIDVRGALRRKPGREFSQISVVHRGLFAVDHFAPQTGLSVTSGRIVYVVGRDPGVRDSVAALAVSIGFRSQEYTAAEEFLASYDRTQRGCLVLEVRLPD